jgi:predicted metalloprotease with PDZ domain
MPAKKTTPPPAAPVHYRVEVLDPHAHLFGVTLTVARPARKQVLSLPVWIPGSYLVREFSQHLQHLRVVDGAAGVAGRTLRQTAKNRWEVQTSAAVPKDQPLVVQYEVYAFDASVRTAFLDQTRGFFNPTSLCLRVLGQEEETHALQLAANAHTRRLNWQAAAALATAKGLGKAPNKGFATYTAQNYDELADTPFELGTFWSGSFKVRGVEHRFIVSGLGADGGALFDTERLLRDTERICAAQMDFWHGSQKTPKEQPPFGHYLFMLHACQSGYGGLEHRHCTALICQRADLPQAGLQPAGKPTGTGANDGYTTLLGLISHEYFHSWNVKRLRPAEFRRYDYEQENYTQLLWFFEGFTSYYDDLLLRRAGLIDEATYLQLLSKTINTVLQTPGRHVQSVAQASFDAWVKYYRMTENTPNATVSYYTKGSLVALCLDLTLRLGLRLGGKQADAPSLDAVMRELWRRCAAGPLREADVLAALKTVGARAYTQELTDWVHGTADLPLKSLLEAAGLVWNEETAPLAQRLGVRVSASEATGLLVKQVLRGSPAEQAGLAAGDEWLAVRCSEADAWRVKKIDDVAQATRGHQRFTAVVARDGRLLDCPVELPTGSYRDGASRQVLVSRPAAALNDSTAPWRDWLRSA